MRKLKVHVVQVLPRKIIAAAISGSIYVIFFALVKSNIYENNGYSPWQYVEMIVVTTLGYMLFSFPVIFLYGPLSSIISDLLSSILTKNGSVKLEFLLSLLFHLIFGLLLLWISLPVAIIYFIIDRYLRKRKSLYKWNETYKILLIPIGLFLLYIMILVVEDFTVNWKDYMVF